MKIYLDFEGQIRESIKNAIPFSHSICDEVKDADLIIVQSKKRLDDFFSQNKYFAVFSTKEISNLPPNVLWLPMFDYCKTKMDVFLQGVQAKLELRGYAK